MKGNDDTSGVHLRYTWASIALVASVTVWALGDFILTLVYGHPTKRTVEVPLAELVVFLILAIPVLFRYLRRKDPALFSVFLFSLYCILSGIFSGAGIRLTAVTTVLLVAPFLALLVSVEVKGTGSDLCRKFFLFVCALQLIVLPANYFGFLADADVEPVDRISGTLLGQGGFLSSYVLIVTAAFLVLTTRSWFARIAVSALAVAYSWLAEVKLGVPAFTAILMAAQFVRAGAHKMCARLLSVSVIGVFGLVVFVALPPAWTLNHDDIATVSRPSEAFDSLFMRSTESNAYQASPLSKFALTMEVLNPMSDLWVGQQASTLLGVGLGSGLSHGARLVDRGVVPGPQGADQTKWQWRERVLELRSTKESRASIVLAPESTLSGVVSELGWMGLVLFLAAGFYTFKRLFSNFQKVYVSIPLALSAVFIPLTSVWEIPGIWLFVALGLAAFGTGIRTVPRARELSSGT